ncbi:MAG: glycosyltransferase family 2 protein [Bacteroidetes bacterium]|nr:glycosyltransferase family 2 protein [Bacteroidota bacterium]MBL6943930.1 glycosyltransferase family 2 protein [Bacteroidales bacterium]
MIDISENIRSKNKENFSIIIPTWNNLDYLKLCIKSLRLNSSFDNQIIVAVNEGNDGTLEWIDGQKEIDYIHSEANLGICYAVNSCRPHVNTNYIVYMNDDMYACPGWDAELLNEINKLDTDYFLLSSTLIEPVKTTNPNYVAIIKNFGNSIQTFKEEELLLECNNLLMKNWCGSSWPPTVIHKKTWDMVGGFSIEFTPGMYSDPDFSMKLWQAGVRIFYGVGKSKVYHFGEKSTGRVKKNMGSNTFLLKWGLSARTYYSEYLNMGKEYIHKYPENVLLKKTSKIRYRIKRIVVSIRSFV